MAGTGSFNARRETDGACVAARPRSARALRMVDGAFQLLSDQLDLVTASSGGLDPGANDGGDWRERPSPEEVLPESSLLRKVLGPAYDKAEAEMRRMQTRGLDEEVSASPHCAIPTSMPSAATPSAALSRT